MLGGILLINVVIIKRLLIIEFRDAPKTGRLFCFIDFITRANVVVLCQEGKRIQENIGLVADVAKTREWGSPKGAKSQRRYDPVSKTNSQSSQTNPKVTLLMGTYNRPDYLRDAIQSVVAQTMKDWELILMNDGGVDVRDVVSQFDDCRIQYYHDPVNRGFAFRLNEGLKRAAGEYIAYLGDDDLYYPNHFEVLSKALDGNPDIGAVYSDLYAVQFNTVQGMSRL